MVEVNKRAASWGTILLPASLFACLAYSSALKMEEVRSSETSEKFYEPARTHMSEETSLHSNRRENMKSHRRWGCLPSETLEIKLCTKQEFYQLQQTGETCIMRHQGWAPVNAVMAWNFLTSWRTISFSRRILFHGLWDLLAKGQSVSIPFCRQRRIWFAVFQEEVRGNRAKLHHNLLLHYMNILRS
jgi:hypothetical protein